MPIPFLTEPVALWEYLSLHRHKSAANTTTKHPHTPNSSQNVTAINGNELSWELQILLRPKPIDKCYNTASIIYSHKQVSEILIFKLILICKFQNVPCALGFKVKL